jgi:hypothetical protein
MKKLSIILLVAWFCITYTAEAQNLYIAQTTEVKFFSATPIEDIQATNTKVSSLLNSATGEVAIKMNIRDFHFPNNLMEEHFNENYMETEKYPTALFKGKIKEAIDYTKDGTYVVNAQGILTMHGIAKERLIQGTLVVKGNQLALTCNFDVPLAEHKIDIPKIVIAKIAEVIAVKAQFSYVPYQKTAQK